MVPIRTRPDGSKYPITPRKGAGAAVAAVMVGSAVALGAGGTGGAAVGGAVDSAVGNATNRIVGQTVRTRVRQAKLSARAGRRAEALARMGLRQLQRKIDGEFQCAIHSYGQVRQFFVLGLAEVTYTGKFYDSRIDAELVVIAESAVLTGRPDPDMLDGAAQVAAQLPAP